MPAKRTDAASGSVTITDIARTAGVSKSTVSLVLQGSPRIKPETAARVREAAPGLGYVYNRSAADLRRKSSNIIGVAINDLLNPFFAELLVGMERKLVEAGYIKRFCRHWVRWGRGDRAFQPPAIHDGRHPRAAGGDRRRGAASPPRGSGCATAQMCRHTAPGRPAIDSGILAGARRATLVKYRHDRCRHLPESLERKVNHAIRHVGPAGTIAVSGLPQLAHHEFLVRAVREFLAKIVDPESGHSS